MWLLDPASGEPYHGELPIKRVPLGFMAFLAAILLFSSVAMIVSPHSAETFTEACIGP